MSHRLLVGLTAGSLLAAARFAAPNDDGAAAPVQGLKPSGGGDPAPSVAAAETPRDETAFSLDPFTNAPAGPNVAAANLAMQQLAKGQGEKSPHIQGLDVEPLDEKGFNEAVAQDE